MWEIAVDGRELYLLVVAEGQLVEVPRSFAEFGVWQQHGDEGRRWLAALPELVAEWCTQWTLRVDGAVRHGYNGIAVPVVRDGEPLMLKVNWPDGSVAAQAEALRFWDGRGTVRLIESAPDVLLLERLDNTRVLRDLPLRQAIPVAGAILRRLAVPAPDGFGTTGAVATELRRSLRQRWYTVGRPFPQRILDTAVGYAGELVRDRHRLMVDTDLGYDHVLAGRREPWLVIDPRPLAGVLEYQVAQLLWVRFDEIDGTAGVRWCRDALVDAAGLDPTTAHAWAVVRAVDYWLWGLAAGFTEDPVRCRHLIAALT